MKKNSLSIVLEIYDHINELPDQIKKLMLEAQKARELAYAPYSRFKVGAAVLLANEQIVLGNNQENAAYPSGLCAERVAVFAAGANYPETEIKAIAITARAGDRILTEPIAPCGSCRQAMAEYEYKQHSPIEVFFMGEDGPVYRLKSVADLLPFGFSSKYL